MPPPGIEVPKGGATKGRETQKKMESFFSSLKREELYRTKYRSEAEFRAAVDAYMVFYNERRPHAKNGYRTPMKLESIYFCEQKEPETMS